MAAPPLPPPPNDTPLAQNADQPGPAWARWFELLRVKTAALESAGSGSAAGLSNASPADIGTTAAGVATDASRHDHVHAHGSQAGGSLHSAAVAAGASGFLTGTDKSKLDALPASYLALGATSPADVGTTAVGVATTAAHADHVHAHGNQLGGSLHAVVGASAGFMSAADKTKLDTIAASAAALTASSPANVGTTAVGVATDAARADHVHAHGNQLGGSLHSVAVAGVSAGFISAADQATLSNTSGINTGDGPTLGQILALSRSWALP